MRSKALPVVAAALLPFGSAAGADTRTTEDGVYSEAQARRGRAVHEAHCARCHERSDYQGDFLEAWKSVPVSVLYDVIELKMPEDAPGSLPPESYAALLAYVFELNDLPPGDEALPHDRQAMEDILIDKEK